MRTRQTITSDQWPEAIIDEMELMRDSLASLEDELRNVQQTIRDHPPDVIFRAFQAPTPSETFAFRRSDVVGVADRTRDAGQSWIAVTLHYREVQGSFHTNSRLPVWGTAAAWGVLLSSVGGRIVDGPPAPQDWPKEAWWRILFDRG